MFKKAIREQAFLRLAFMGPAGSGKTYTSLLIAKHLGAKKIAVIDSERGSAKLYSHLVDFDVCELESFAAERYIDAIVFAERAGYDTIIIDSLSHAWAGKDGILEYKDKRTDASRSKDSFGAGWRDATPLHNKLVDTILAFKGHVICTLRTKTEYVIEDNGNGRKTPRKLGMAPIQRDGVEYEFTVVGDFVESNKLAITKTRCEALHDAVITKPGREMAETLLAWLGSAMPVGARAAISPDIRCDTPAALTQLDEALATLIADFPTRADEARQVASDAHGDAQQLAALRSAYRRFSAEAKALDGAAKPSAETAKLVAEIGKIRRAIAGDFRTFIGHADDIVAAYLNGRKRLEEVSEPDLRSLVGELRGTYTAASRAEASPAGAAA